MFDSGMLLSALFHCSILFAFALLFLALPTQVDAAASATELDALCSIKDALTSTNPANWKCNGPTPTQSGGTYSGWEGISDNLSDQVIGL